MSTKLGSVDVDPLDTMLLNPKNSTNNNSASEEDDFDVVCGAQDQDQPGDWSKFGALWSSHHAPSFKSYNDFMDFSDFSSTVPMSMPMDTDLGITMGMDYPYSSMMGIDPASLHFNTAAAGLGLGGGFGLVHDVSTFSDSYAAPAAAFSIQQQHPQQQQHSVIAPLSTQGSATPESFVKERRLSVTSSSSSSSSVSGASLSPMPDHYNALSPPSGYTSDNASTKDEPSSNSITDADSANSNPYANDPSAELAHRVRQSAGVMLAVPINGFGTSFQGANVSAGKLPIPRLNRSSTTTTSMYAKSTATNALSSSSSSAASTPPPSTPPSTSHSPLNVSTSTSTASVRVPTSPTVAPPRPKTSHTTIERRYRTNLNARIQSLRMAVPALRVLEDQGESNGKRIKKNIKGGVIVKGGGIGIGIECSEDGSVIDVIDERGFVDGVKVARKCSKANVLGKAVEYIRVLKRRERRLKSELAGVKVLVEGLVGGPALIKEWEKQWRARFGGEEKDEIEEDDEEGEGDDDESEDEDGEHRDEEAGRKRKRARVAPTSTGGGTSKKVDSKKEKKTSLPPVLVLAGEQVPEKRKRGRPRKILPPPVTLEPVASVSTPALLPAAVIVRRDGLGPIKQDEVMEPAELSGQLQQQQQQSPPQRFLLAVFALFSFFNSPLTSSMGRDHTPHNHHHHTGKVLTPLHPPLVYSPEIVSQFVQYPPSSVVVDALSTTSTPVWKEYVQLFHLLVSFLVLASFVGNWFGFGVSGFRFSFEKRSWGLRSTSRTGRDKKGKGTEDWIRFAEESVLSGEAGSLSHYERFQIYRTISDRKGVSLGSLVSAAVALNTASGVALGGLSRMTARAIWDDARRKVQGNSKAKVKEEIVFGTMGLDEACERLAGCVKRGDSDEMSDGEREYALIEVLACGIVKERLRRHLLGVFVDLVGGEDEEIDQEEQGKSEEETKRRKTVDASRELGGSVEEMGRLFERMWKIGVGGVEMGDVEGVFADIQSVGGVNEEIRALFVALVLYSRLFGGGSSESSEETETERGLSSSSDTVTVSISSLLSPPPSPGKTSGSLVSSKIKNSKRDKMMLELRRVLGCRVFEGCAGGGSEHECGVVERKVGGVEGLEEARDLIVDLIVDFERRDR